MAKYQVRKAQEWKGRIYEVGSIIDFGDTPPPKSAIKVEEKEPEKFEREPRLDLLREDEEE